MPAYWPVSHSALLPGVRSPLSPSALTLVLSWRGTVQERVVARLRTLPARGRAELSPLLGCYPVRGVAYCSLPVAARRLPVHSACRVTRSWITAGVERLVRVGQLSESLYCGA